MDTCLHSAVSAPSADIIPPFVIVDGEYAVVPSETDDLIDEGSLTFSIFCSAETDIKFEAEIFASDPQSNSFRIQFDDNQSRSWRHPLDDIWDQWIWRELTVGNNANNPQEWMHNAGVGDHKLIILPREDGTKIRNVRFLEGHPDCAFKTCQHQSDHPEI